MFPNCPQADITYLFLRTFRDLLYPLVIFVYFIVIANLHDSAGM